MKKFLTATFFTGVLLLTSSVFATQKSVDCSSRPVFTTNTCDVCLEDTATTTTPSVDLKDIKIPWTNTQTLVSEVAYKVANDVPDVITDLTFVTSPALPHDLWKFTNPWTSDLNEFALAPTKSTTFSETNTGGKITVTDKSSVTDKFVLIRSPLVYHERKTADLSETQDAKTRNTCLLYTITFPKSTITSPPAGGYTQSGGTAPDTTNSVTSDTPNTATTDVTNTPTPTPVPTPTPITTTSTSDTAPVDDTAPTLNSAPAPKATTIQTGPSEDIFFFVAVLSAGSIVFLRRKYARVGK